MRQAWEELHEPERSAAWDRFERTFAFHPSTSQTDFPSIREPRPSITWHLHPSPWNPHDEVALHHRLLAAFRACTAPEEAIYALDWQHACYWFRPHVPFDWYEFGQEWPVPVLPNGDYSIFLSLDFSWGLFGHPWEWTICLFGAPLLATIAGEQIPLLTSIVRSQP
jgi:hypothetical protein